MRKCIICNTDKEDSDFNEEHIIPAILGNKTFTIRNVCTTCNSLMGSKLIAPLSERDFVVSFRKRHNLKGNSGKQAKYKRLTTSKDGIKVVRNQEGQIEIGPQVQDIEGGFVVIGSNPEKLQKIAEAKERKAERKWEYQIEEKILEVTFSHELDCRFILAYIAVCYETMFYLFGYDYLNDSVAKELQSILYNYLYHEQKMPAIQIRELDPDIAKIFFSEFHGDKNSVMVALSFDETSVGAIFIIDGISLLDLRVGNNAGMGYGSGYLILALEDGHIAKFDPDYIAPQ